MYTGVWENWWRQTGCQNHQLCQKCHWGLLQASGFLTESDCWQESIQGNVSCCFQYGCVLEKCPEHSVIHLDNARRLVWRQTAALWGFKRALCSAAFLCLVTVLSSVWKYWSEQNADIRAFLKNSMLFLKGHWKVCPWGGFTVSTFQPGVCPQVWTREVHVPSLSLCVETALWEPLSCSHLNFNLYGQNRKEGGLPVCYIFCSSMLLSSDE